MDIWPQNIVNITAIKLFEVLDVVSSLEEECTSHNNIGEVLLQVESLSCKDDGKEHFKAFEHHLELLWVWVFQNRGEKKRGKEKVSGVSVFWDLESKKKGKKEENKDYEFENPICLYLQIKN